MFTQHSPKNYAKDINSSRLMSSELLKEGLHDDLENVF